MALKSYALTTVQRLKDFMGLGTTTAAQDTTLETIINAATEYIEQYIGFRVKKTTYTEEMYDTDNSPSLTLKRRPVDSASSFILQRRNSSLNENSWETIDSQYIHVDYNAGIIYGAGGWKFFKSRQGYRVTYSAGYDFNNSSTFLSDTEAGDLELAIWMIAKDMYNTAGREAGVIREAIGDYEIEYSEASDETISAPAMDILNKYSIDVAGVQTPYVY